MKRQTTGIFKHMLKASYIITLLSGIGIFNSCTGNFINMPEYQQEHAYLLQRILHTAIIWPAELPIYGKIMIMRRVIMCGR